MGLKIIDTIFYFIAKSTPPGTGYFIYNLGWRVPGPSVILNLSPLLFVKLPARIRTKPDLHSLPRGGNIPEVLFSGNIGGFGDP